MGEHVSKEAYIELVKRYAAIKADRDRMGKALEWYEALGRAADKDETGADAMYTFAEDAGKRAREALGDE